MIDVAGPHRSLSGFDGVIQFNVVLSACIARAAYDVHPGQFGISSAAEVTLNPMQASIGTDSIAAIRPGSGSTPS